MTRESISEGFDVEPAVDITGVGGSGMEWGRRAAMREDDRTGIDNTSHAIE